jgi:hypothetical protein
MCEVQSEWSVLKWGSIVLRRRLCLIDSKVIYIIIYNKSDNVISMTFFKWSYNIILLYYIISCYNNIFKSMYTYNVIHCSIVVLLKSKNTIFIDYISHAVASGSTIISIYYYKYTLSSVNNILNLSDL